MNGKTAYQHSTPAANIGLTSRRPRLVGLLKPPLVSLCVRPTYMKVETEKLAGMLESISTTLTAFGEKHWADWVSEDARRLRNGDLSGADHFLSAFGGMGSINDLYICPRNGHRIAETEVLTKNEGLKGALSEAYELPVYR